MKKIIKRSELYDSFKYGREYYEVFINPSDREIKDVMNASNNKSIRGVIYEDNTQIIWNGNILHGYINNYVKKSINVEKQFRFAYEPNHGWLLDAGGKSLKDVIDQFKQHKDFLNRIGNTKGYIDIWYSSELESFETTIKTFEEDYNQTVQDLKDMEDDEKLNGDQLLIYNPNDEQINQFKNIGKAIEGYLYSNGEVVIWNYSGAIAKVKSISLYFAYNFDNRTWHLEDYLNNNEMKAFADNLNLFSKIGDVNGNIVLLKMDEFKETTLEEYQKSIAASKKIKRLIKH